MRVAIEQESSKLSFLLNFEEGDNEKPSERFGIGERQASIIAEGFDLSDVHPDLIALSAILIASPFVGKELKIPFPVRRVHFESKLYCPSTNWLLKVNLVPSHRGIHHRDRDRGWLTAEAWIRLLQLL